MRVPSAPIPPNDAAESGQLIRTNLMAGVRIWEELPGNGRREHRKVAGQAAQQAKHAKPQIDTSASPSRRVVEDDAERVALPTQDRADPVPEISPVIAARALRWAIALAV